MVNQIGFTVGGDTKTFQGLSTDTKPIINVGEGSTFYELDTCNGWIYDGVNVNPITGTKWWGV